AELERWLDRVVRPGEHREPWDGRRHEGLRERLARLLRRLGVRADAELGVDVRPGRIEVDEDDALSELREVNGEVLRDEALADAAATPADREHPSRSPRQLDLRGRDRFRRRRRKAFTHFSTFVRASPPRRL